MISLLLATALAAPPSPSTPASEAQPTAGETTRPIVVEPWQEPVNFVMSAEPVGQGDDRTAARLEEKIRPQADAFLTCWRDVLKAGEEPFRYVQIRVRMNTVSGAVRKAKIQASSGAESFDTCLTDLVGATVLDPPSMFPDRIDIALTFARPTIKKDEE